VNIPDALGNIGGAVAGFAGVSASDSASRRNDRLQRNIHGLNQLQAKEFARYGIQYRVSDALEAGINPLAALGANISSPAPTSVGGLQADVSGYSRAGQNLGEAIGKLLSDDKVNQEHKELQNELLRSRIQLNKANARTFNPGNASQFTVEQPLNKVKEGKVQTGGDPSFINDWALAKRAGGGYRVVPSKDVKERIEDQFVPEIQWFVDNYGQGVVNDNPFIKHLNKMDPPKKGYKWRFSPWKLVIEQVKTKSKIKGTKKDPTYPGWRLY